MGNLRQERMNAEIARVLSEVLTQKINNPILQGIITVESVSISSDFSHCKVSFSSIEDDKKKRSEILAQLNRTKGFFRHEIAENVEIRVVPDLDFSLSENSIYSKRIEDILKTLDIPKEVRENETEENETDDRN